MPDEKISLLPNAGPLDGTEIVPITQDGTTVQVELSVLASWLSTAAAIVPTNLPYRGARVRLSADFSPPTTGFNIVSWGTEDRDTDNIWSSGQPTRLVVPAGVTKVRVGAYIRTNTAAQRFVFFKWNGVYAQGMGGGGDNASAFDTNISTSVLDVTPGDYFELEVWGATAAVSAGLANGLGSWFEMEIKEYT